SAPTNAPPHPSSANNHLPNAHDVRRAIRRGTEMPDFGDVPEPTSGGAGAAAGATIGGAIGAIGKNMGEAQKQSSALLDSAKSGGFRVGENAGKDLQDALTEALDDLDKIIIEADQL